MPEEGHGRTYKLRSTMEMRPAVHHFSYKHLRAVNKISVHSNKQRERFYASLAQLCSSFLQDAVNA